MLKINKLLLLLSVHWFIVLDAMEDRFQLTSRSGEQTIIDDQFVRLEFCEDDDVIYSLVIPFKFAQKFSVVENNRAFQNGEELCVPVLASDITDGQFKSFKEFSEHFEGNVKKSIKKLCNSWSTDSLSLVVDLVTISNYLGNDEAVRYSIKALNRALQATAAKKNWTNFFKLVKDLSVCELQNLLSIEIKKNDEINDLIVQLYKPKPPLELNNAFNPGYDIVVGTRWLCVMSTASLKDGKSETSVLDLQTLEPACEHTIKRKFGAIKISPSGDLMLGLPKASGINMPRRGQGEVYSFKTGEITGILPLEETINSWCFSSDGKFIIANAKHRIYILDSDTLCIKKHLSINSSFVYHLASSADGKFIAFKVNTSNGYARVEVWDIEQEKKHWEFTEELEKRIHCLLFSPNSRYLAYAVSNGKVKICDLYDTTVPSILQAGNMPNNSALLAFSPDSKLLATYYSEYMYRHDSVMHIWDYKKNKIKKTYNNGGYKYIKALSFSPDGKKLACIKGFSEARCKDLFIYDLIDPLKNLSLQPLILLWYCSIQAKAHEPMNIPQEYSEAFEALPQEIREYFSKQT